jgi:hypothetical protein
MTTLNKGVWFYPDYSEEPPDEYYEQKFQEHCDENDAKAKQELFDLAIMSESIGATFTSPRPAVATIISNLYLILDDSHPVEASLKHLMEKAERICAQSVIVEREVFEGMDSSPSAVAARMSK